MATPHSPPFKTVEAMLRFATEYFAHQVTHPSDTPPAWSETEWRIGKAVLSMQGMSVQVADAVLWRGPEYWQDHQRQQGAQTLLRYERIAELLIQLDAAARRERVSLVALKGAALCRMGIYRPGERPMGDIDLLVRAEDATAASKIIESVGYSLAFEMRRHAAFEPNGEKKFVGLGEHIDNPIKIELHTKIAEPLPIAEVDITEIVLPRNAQPGVNDYPSIAALMRHLLLHAAGNIRARALRQIQLHDIALLAQRMSTSDWSELLATNERRGLWWALPPLALTGRYYGDCIPAAVVAATAPGCPRWLRRVTRRSELTDVSWSKIRIEAFPGIEWSKSAAELLAFAKTRLIPSRTELTALKYTAATQTWATQVPWYGQKHITRILRWIFSNPPRAQTMFSVQCALQQDAPRSSTDETAPPLPA